MGNNSTGNATSQSYNIIKQAIVQGRYTPGYILSERGLSTQLKVSRTPIRQALQQLAQEGLVSRGPQGAFVISDISIDELEELFLLRERLEGLAARLAANRMSAEEVQALKAHIELHAEEFQRGNRMNEFDFDVNLHISILKSSNSPKLRLIVEQLLSQIQRL